METLKPKETKPIECNNYFINGQAEIRNFTKIIDLDELTYNFTDNSTPVSFTNFEGPLSIFEGIYNGDINLEDLEKKKIHFKTDLGYISQGPTPYKSFKRLSTVENVKNLYESRENVVQLFNNYAKNMSKNIYKSKEGK